MAKPPTLLLKVSLALLLLSPAASSLTAPATTSTLVPLADLGVLAGRAGSHDILYHPSTGELSVDGMALGEHILGLGAPLGGGRPARPTASSSMAIGVASLQAEVLFLLDHPSEGGSGSLSGTGGSFSWTRYSLGPSGVAMGDLVFDQAGITVCDSSAVVGLIPALACGTGGLGAIFDIAAIDRGTASGDFVHGTCEVVPTATNTDAVAPSNYVFACGSDRDDDGFVTDLDLTGSSDCGADTVCGNSDDDGYDDDASSGHQDDPQVNVCFARDRNNADLLNAANSDFDDVAVFILLNVPNPPPAVGEFKVELKLVQDTGCGGGNRSNHTHAIHYS